MLEAPVITEYLPSGHETQSILLLSYFPAGQLEQEEDEEAPTTVEIDPAGQEVQDEEPEIAAYLPAAQDVQVSSDVTP